MHTSLAGNVRPCPPGHFSRRPIRVFSPESRIQPNPAPPVRTAAAIGRPPPGHADDSLGDRGMFDVRCSMCDVVIGRMGPCGLPIADCGLPIPPPRDCRVRSGPGRIAKAAKPRRRQEDGHCVGSASGPPRVRRSRAARRHGKAPQARCPARAVACRPSRPRKRPPVNQRPVAMRERNVPIRGLNVRSFTRRGSRSDAAACWKAMPVCVA